MGRHFRFSGGLLFIYGSAHTVLVGAVTPHNNNYYYYTYRIHPLIHKHIDIFARNCRY